MAPARPEGPRSFTRSEDETHTDHRSEPGWHTKCYPEAGEAVIYFVPPTGEGASEFWASLTDEEREAENHARAVRRAKGEMRRYMTANGLRYMWVLTNGGEGLHGPEGRAQMMRRTARLVSLIRERHGGKAFPYLYSPELHPKGHGWHVNLFLPMHVRQRVVHALWTSVDSKGPAPCGFVWASDWARDPRARSVRDGVRQGARYASKYASKDWASEMLEGGQHRYEVGQGFKPAIVRRWAKRRDTAEAQALYVFHDEPPMEVWRSDDDATWSAPPVICMKWP